jgi:hypothetical protein
MRFAALLALGLCLTGCFEATAPSTVKHVDLGGVLTPISDANKVEDRLIPNACAVEAQGTPAHSDVSKAILSDSQQVKKDLEEALLNSKKVDEALRAKDTEEQKLLDRNVYLESKYSESVKLLWKWRLITVGILAAVAGFFVLRQYIPFLKLI